MKIAVLKETEEFEARVAATPETVKKLLALGATSISVEQGAGEKASYLDTAFTAAGATIAKDAAAAIANADIILTVQGLSPALAKAAKKNAILLGILAPFDNASALKDYAAAGLSAFALEMVPRITRAQAMDVLSSQSNLAGYRAVIEAAQYFTRAFPMMMTAAGTIPPARVLVLGAGVAGLQAIATARRLGAVVSAFDVRAAAKEQVQSLGATFVEVDGAEDAETKGGYAKEMSDDFKKRQQAKIAETLAKTDIVISTALIPGKPAPELITEEMVKGMKAGSVIVDLAVERGGNCKLSQLGKVVVKHDVAILGYANLPSRIATDASALYARNLLNLIQLLYNKDEKKLLVNREDDIVAGSLITHDGTIVHPQFGGSPAPAPAPKPAQPETATPEAEKPAAPKPTAAKPTKAKTSSAKPAAKTKTTKKADK